MKTLLLQPERIHSGPLILVNARRPYDEGANRRALRSVDPTAPRVLLDASAAGPLARLMDKLNGWERITAVSGWRSWEEQRELYARSLRENGPAFTEQYVALPGHSEHQTGLAIDLALRQEEIDFIRPDFPYTGVCLAFRRLAASFGFVERYPRGKESITGIAREPWHFRYVGTPHAAIMEQHGFVLEEYIAFLKNYPCGKAPYVYEAGKPRAAVSYWEAGPAARLEWDGAVSCEVSGNNVDGLIITAWRDPRERT